MTYNAVDQILIPHTAFNTGVSRVMQCLRASEGAREPLCIALIGESRTGKTRLLSHIEKAHPRHRMDDGLRIPILRVSTPAVPFINGLAETILCAIGDPIPGKGTETNKTTRIIMHLKECGTRMIMVDEFQHFYDRERRHVKQYVADWFKVLIDECKVSLVVSGLPSCQAVLNHNEQLAGRSLGPIHMRRFDWKNENMRAEFFSILEAFHQGLSQFDMPKLDSEEMAFRFYCATGGLIGYMVKILRQAVWNALDANTRRISLEDLALAYDQAVYQDESSSCVLRAFDRGFMLQINEALFGHVNMIGTAKPEEVKPRRTRKKKEAQSLGEVLHA